jgi:cysteine synthase
MKIRAMDMANKADHHYVDQFGSLEVLNGYIPMGMEMAKEMKGKIDVFCASIGTGGALMGATKGLNISGVHPKIIALEPLQSPLISTGKGGAHKVDGIGIGFYPPFLDRTKIHEVQTIDQHDAFNMCELLAKEEGVFCGTSTGMNVHAAIEIAKKLGNNRKVLTLACDSGYKYL